MVWVDEHQYAEFTLEDEAGKGHWYPVQSAGSRAFGEMRRLMLSASDQPLETQLELEAQGLARMAATADAREGITAFAEKRKPSFSGH